MEYLLITFDSYNFRHNPKECTVVAQFNANTIEEVWEYLATKSSNELLHSVFYPNDSPSSAEFSYKEEDDDPDYTFDAEDEEMQGKLNLSRGKYNTGRLLKEYATNVTRTYRSYVVEVKPLFEFLTKVTSLFPKPIDLTK